MSTTPAETIVLWDPRIPSLKAWRAAAAPGATAHLSRDDGEHGAALRADVTLAGHGSWAILRYEAPLVLPPHYVVTLTVRGALPPTELQVKLVDDTGANVWWWRLRPHVFTPAGQRLLLRRAALAFAWGPASGGDPARLGAVEIAVAADDGRTGTFWIDELRIESRPVVTTPLAVADARASSHAAGHPPTLVRTGNPGACWRPAPDDPAPWLEIDLGCPREWGGLVVDAADATGFPSMRLNVSDDATRWTPLLEVPATKDRRRWLRSADAEGRYARLEFPDGGNAGIAKVIPVPLELALSPARYAMARAAKAPRGHYPRHLRGEQTYWAVVGADGDARKGLLGEDGALEVDAEGFSLEPFLWHGGRLVTWADADHALTLEDGHLPIPSVEWRLPTLRLRVTACAAGPAGASTLVVRYALHNATAAERQVRLYVAIRPYQVNPSWQSLNLVGGIARIERLEREGAVVRVNGVERVVAVGGPDGFGAAPFEEGLAALAEGSSPAAEAMDDPVGLAEAALWFDFHIPAAATRSATLAVPLHDATPAPPAGLSCAEATTWAEVALTAVRDHWRRRLSTIPLALPPAAAAFDDTLRASIAWILVNRDGPRIQPGPRCYRRSWIRDGTLTGTALVEMGFADEARDFLHWYAPFQYDDGRVPCAVDRHGVDAVAEHDSHGQFVWGIVEVFRLTGDRAFLETLWPQALRAVDALVALRAERTTDAHRGRPTFGLLPESISHEGYASRPVHSYWDDFFAVRALTDAVWAAGVLGDTAAARRIAPIAEAMRHDLQVSVPLAMAEHHLTVLPGSVELGDFDPTSSAIAFDPCGVETLLPDGALTATFERYWAELDARRRGAAPNDAYTPYEVRNATALLRLGWPDRALEQLAWLVADQRPPAWRQWPEIAWRDPRAPRFFGDLPHGWVASSFVRTVRRLLVYERDDEGTLVVAAGIPGAWVQAPGVRARALPTHFGPLDLTICALGADEVLVRLEGQARPPGGVVVTSPGGRAVHEAFVDGRAHPGAGSRTVHVAALPAEVRLRYHIIASGG